MKPSEVLARIGFVLAVAGCQVDEHTLPARSILSVEEAREAFDSQAGLQRALEHRWPLSAIKEFCTPQRRHDPEWQNLVTDTSVVWRGDLYPEADTGFEKIFLVRDRRARTSGRVFSQREARDGSLGARDWKRGNDS